MSRPTLDLYTTEGETVPDVNGTRRKRVARKEVEPSRIRCRCRLRTQPVVPAGSLAGQMSIGVMTLPRRGEGILNEWRAPRDVVPMK